MPSNGPFALSIGSLTNYSDITVAGEFDCVDVMEVIADSLDSVVVVDDAVNLELFPEPPSPQTPKGNCSVAADRNIYVQGIVRVDA